MLKKHCMHRFITINIHWDGLNTLRKNNETFFYRSKLLKELRDYYKNKQTNVDYKISFSLVFYCNRLKNIL